MKNSALLSLLLILLIYLCSCSGGQVPQEDRPAQISSASEGSAANSVPPSVTQEATQPAAPPETAPVTQEATQPVTVPVTEPATDAVTEPSAPGIPAAEYVIGTINAKDGLSNPSNTTRLHNAAYLPVAEVAGVTVQPGYQLTWLAYAQDKSYLGNGNNYSGLWQPDGGPIRTADILRNYPDAVYFRYAIKNLGGTQMSLSDIEKSGVAIVPADGGDTLKYPEKTFSYTGTGISPQKTLTLSELPSIPSGQDGAIFGDLIFRFGNNGSGNVVSLPDGKAVGTVTMDKTDLICPHSNSVSFGTRYYADGDEFPLLYSSVYNTYASAADRRVGYCCVYRLTRDGANFRAALVQIIRIGFAEDLSLWASKPGAGDVRPYGNFVADDRENLLWAFVMRDADQVTRVYSFDLPAPTAGTADAALGGIPVVTLEEKDIRTRFDAGYSHYIQGATVLDGLIYSLEGFTDGKKDAPPAIRVFDTKSGTEAALIDLFGAGFTVEPEFISVYRGTLYYSDAKGTLMTLQFH